MATSIYRAYAPEAEGVTGQFFAIRKPKTSSKASYNTAAATTRLWQISADLAAINTDMQPPRITTGNAGDESTRTEAPAHMRVICAQSRCEIQLAASSS